MVRIRSSREIGVLLAGCLLVMSSCGPPPAKDKVVEPAKPKNVATIYGVDANGGSVEIPLVGAKSERKVNPMAVMLGETATGVLGESTLSTEPTDSGEVGVFIGGNISGGLGPQWEAAIWLSSFIAASALNKDLTDFEFRASASGRIDGPSAGALMTVGFLASMIGDEIDPKATMTGTVNPDGTVGTVGGIVHKFTKALEEGKTRLGYPIGRRYDIDMNTNERVDLEQLARDAGGEAHEISDIWEAYEFLTGKKLPVALPVDQKEMRLDDAVERMFKSKYDSWKAEFDSNFNDLVDLYQQGQLVGGTLTLAEEAEREFTAAESLLSQGLTSSAYNRMLTAVTYAATARLVWMVQYHVALGDINSAVDTLSVFTSSIDATREAMDKVGAIVPSTLGGHLQMISAFQSAIPGWGFNFYGSEALMDAAGYLAQLYDVPAVYLGDPALQEELFSKVLPGALTMANSFVNSQRALEAIEIEAAQSINYQCSLPAARRLAKSYSSAATANISYFESIAVEPAAKDAGMHLDNARAYYMSVNNDYLIAYHAMAMPDHPGMPAELKASWGENSLPWSLGVLSGALLSYFKVSLLVAEQYSLQVQYDMFGAATSVANEKAFISAMNGAERKARQHANSAKVATGEIPIQSRIHYQNAAVLREGTLADKLRALQLFWMSSMYSQTATMLTRNPGGSK